MKFLNLNGMNRITRKLILQLETNEVFVFGSNKAGHHIGGAAKQAHLNFGAQYGLGEGFSGQTYAIDSMSGLQEMAPQIARFIQFAYQHPDKIFLVTEIGCGIAGYKVEDVAPLFSGCKTIGNIHLPQRFWEILNK